jgi:hypothetical protein
MTKKNYQKPTVKVVQLRYKAHILIGSDTPQTLQGHQKSGSETQDTYYELQ